MSMDPYLSELAGLISAARLSPDDIDDLVAGLPPAVVEALLAGTAPPHSTPPDPLSQALALDPSFARRTHLDHLSSRLRVATADVEAGHNRLLCVSMPPRMGKSTLTSHYLSVWLLRAHPDWMLGLVSHDADFATSWGRRVRGTLERNPALGITLAPDVGAASEWETTAGGGVLARSIGGSVTGRGFKVLIMDDVVKGYVDAHSPRIRDTVWDRWRSDIFTRLEPPYLVVVIGTRWHEDDFIGRLRSTEFEGSPADWEVISFPALAEADGDVLGRLEGEPLISPLLPETPEQALARWASVKEAVGSYTWSALYQQRPAPARGSIFDIGWFRYWTTDPSHIVEGDLSPSGLPRIVYLDPATLASASWLDSWDAAFKGTDTSDWVVGQRWVRAGIERYLIAQQRGRWTFTATLEQMRAWAEPYPMPITNPYGNLVHSRLVEEKANGAAIIDVLKDSVAGIKAINPSVGKEGRARAVTPECESGHVLLPHPGDPGNAWVTDLLSELRNFPNDVHDDQVDALTQALSGLREVAPGHITVPGALTAPTPAGSARSSGSSPACRPGPATRPLRPGAGSVDAEPHESQPDRAPAPAPSPHSSRAPTPRAQLRAPRARAPSPRLGS